jgi:beta-mannosidase
MKQRMWTVILVVVAGWICVPINAMGQQEAKALWQPYYISPRTGAEHVSLDGDWELGYRDTPIESLQDLASQPKWIHAQVPSSVQWALFRAGELPHPYLHMNAKQYDWVVEKVWYYRRTFQALPVNSQYVLLCFDGVDYYARVWLNGTLLGRHEGMHGGPVVEVGSLLHPTAPNEVVVEVRAPNYGLGKDWNAWSTGKVTVPWGLTGGLGLITGGGGNKWGPHGPVPGSVGIEDYFPVGIWRSVRLEIIPHLHLERPFLVTKEATSQEAHLELTAEVLANTTSLDFQLHSRMGAFRNAWTSALVQTPLTLQVKFFNKDTPQPVLTQNFPLQVYEGRNWVKEEIRFPRPELWWPNGMGNPHLYRVELALLREGKAMDNLKFDYGIRTIENLPSAGPRTQDRWANWQFVVNGRKFFVKGNDWWTTDILLDLPRERYKWILNTARAGGIQLLRTNGVGIIETEDFYSLCDELGIMVWQDFPIGNMETPEWPQDIWEAQVVQNVFRIRNHPSLAVYCGGNEFNPYSFGNTTTIAILERSVRDFDGTRLFLRTTPDPGDIHVYPDADPTWYQYLYNLVPYVSETGPHTVPEARAIREFVDAGELAEPLRNINSPEFAETHPEFVYHNMEYGLDRGTGMLLARSSQLVDMSTPSLEEYCVAGQVATGEFLQIVSDIFQANYPVTTGLMPWVFNTPWPLSTFCMFVDYDGQPVGPYYFLKRTYEPTHILVKLPHLVWAKGERLPINVSVVQAPKAGWAGLTASVQILNTQFRSLWHGEKKLDVKPGPSVNPVELGEFTLPDGLEEHFFFLLAELKQGDGKVVSRSVYWPRCLKLMADPEFRKKYRASPQPSLTFAHGPWLRKEVAPSQTNLELQLVSRKEEGKDESHFQLRVRNTGSLPAFYTEVNVEGTKRTFYAADNGFWLAPKEERLIDLEVKWRDPATRDKASLTVGAWNAETKSTAVR